MSNTPNNHAGEAMNIDIDLTPYEVAIEGNHLAVKDCGGSVLRNLNNDPEVTGDRFSGESNRLVVEDAQGELREYRVEYHVGQGAEGDTCYFTPQDGKAPALDDIIQWISENFDRMESIGHNTLMDYDEVEAVFRAQSESSGPSPG